LLSGVCAMVRPESLIEQWDPLRTIAHTPQLN
jgi:hypothetical protein